MVAPGKSNDITSIEVPDAVSTSVRGINDPGDVAGAYSDINGGHGFIYGKGSITTLDVPGGSFTDARAINNSRDVAGVYSDSTGRHSFVYSMGTFIKIDLPGLIPSVLSGIRLTTMGRLSEPSFSFPTGTGFHGYIYDKGTVTFLDAPGATGFTSAVAINDRGEVVGNYNDSRFYIYDNGSFITITPPGATFTQVSGINNSGEIVGQFIDSGGLRHGFVDDKGAFTTIDPPGSIETNLTGINNRGEIVGSYVDATGQHGFVENHGTFITIDAREVSGINNMGEIFGSSYIASATGKPSATNLGEILSNAAAGCHANDFLPSMPATGGQLARLASWSSLQDNMHGVHAHMTASFGNTDAIMRDFLIDHA